MCIRAHWLGLIDVNPSDVIKIDPQWLGGALGCRVELRDGRWFATSHHEAQRLRAAAV
jgi:hypothetical protein